MDILNIIDDRTSYRGRYKDTKVAREDLIEIMRAGLAAPSGCNKQTTSLIALDEPELLAEVKDLIDPPICQTAPAIICVLTQRVCAYRDKCFAVQDYSAAIENMLLAIKSLGYESCWYEGHITDDDRIGERIAKRLGVPDGYELVCILPVGIADEPVKRAKKKAFNERAWFNGFEKSENVIQ
ncbi:MAG: nitroreductase family protein [Eubacterium sp.]|nr:nitroreductase family protein [Eubacterium sp.]